MDNGHTFTQDQRDRLIKQKPFGFVFRRGDPVQTKTPFFGLLQEKYYYGEEKDSNCIMALINYLGSGMWIRVYKWDVIFSNESKSNS
jgi:hypothetical protein